MTDHGRTDHGHTPVHVEQASPVKKFINIHHHWTISDHTFQMEEIERGPRSFRAMPGIQYIRAYDAQVRNKINKNLIDLSDLPEEVKSRENLMNSQILQLG